jgi:hypothetical protein
MDAMMDAIGGGVGARIDFIKKVCMIDHGSHRDGFPIERSTGGRRGSCYL